MRIKLPIACSLQGDQVTDRVAAWASLFDDALISGESTDRGVRLRLRSAPEVSVRVNDLIVLEGRCCAWMNFEVHPSSVGSPSETATSTANKVEQRKVAGDSTIVVDIRAEDVLGQQAVRAMFLDH